MTRKSKADTLMKRTRAAVTYLNSGSGFGGEDTKMAAFMALFHPDHDPASTRELITEARKRNRS